MEKSEIAEVSASPLPELGDRRGGQGKGLLTQFCSWSIAIQGLVSCEENGDQWRAPRLSLTPWGPSMDLRGSEEEEGILPIDREKNQKKWA